MTGIFLKHDIRKFEIFHVSVRDMTDILLADDKHTIEIIFLGKCLVTNDISLYTWYKVTTNLIYAIHTLFYNIYLVYKKLLASFNNHVLCTGMY